MKKKLLSCLLLVSLVNTISAQNYLVTRKIVNQRIQEGYFMQRLNTTIANDDSCITAAKAKASLFLNEATLPANGRMPWWLELVPQKTVSCTGGKTLCAVSNAQYSACGAYIYNQGFNNTLTSFTRTKLTNTMWSGVTANCTTVPGTTNGIASVAARTALTADSAIVYKGADSSVSSTTNGVANVQVMATAAAYPGPLNSCGVWPCDNANTTGQWNYIERTINVPVKRTYYMGIAADNAFRFSINGWMVITFGTDSNPEAFRIWHIFPIELGAGLHTLRFEAYNVEDVAALGVEFYDNSAAEITSATSRSSLRIMFTTADTNNAVMCK